MSFKIILQDIPH